MQINAVLRAADILGKLTTSHSRHKGRITGTNL